LQQGIGVYPRYIELDCAKRKKPVGHKGLVAIFLKGRTSRSWAKPRVVNAERSAISAQGIEAEILFYREAEKKCVKMIHQLYQKTLKYQRISVFC
jgi:hypothetical protein